MPLEIIGTREIRYLQVVDEKGEADAALMPALTEAQIREIFEAIILARTFNQRALSLQREGRLGTYASILGQEASQVGSAFAFDKDDWIFPSFRETAVFLTRGYPIWMMFRYWLGDERGMKSPDDINIFPMCVPVGSQIPHAAGAALAMKLKGVKSAAAAYFGDGGSSRGDFHEALNIAGVFKAPAIFLCQNNQWAISVPRARQTAAATIAERAGGYGIEGIQVDGNDVFAVYKATKDALERARAGGGPTLIECFTYRLDDHTTSDDASRYRAEEEVEAWKKKEPLIRLRLYMEKKGLWTKEYEDKAVEKAVAMVDAAIAEEEAFPPPSPSDVIEYTNAELTGRQMKELKEFGWRK
ncbi:MAG: pyruvate dehydrogenase (acetyl-transferring) E1 component subunit alpha [Deltaproteobacteria bacterium]|nr:pyruvate dehydrogenase (acetyl-transferring) E1 component subunit alpha [Deltaproteobacteria bacterium]